MHFSDPQQGIHATSLILLSPAPSLTDKRPDISCQPVSPLQLYPYFTASDMSWEGFVAKKGRHHSINVFCFLAGRAGAGAVIVNLDAHCLYPSPASGHTRLLPR